MRLAWEEAAQELEGDWAHLWEQDWPTVLRAFRHTDNALANLNRSRAEEEAEPLVEEEELQAHFRDSLD